MKAELSQSIRVGAADIIGSLGRLPRRVKPGCRAYRQARPKVVVVAAPISSNDEAP